jgi:hypothetical protein
MSKLKHRNELTAINIINAIAAAFLFISPWLLGYVGEPTSLPQVALRISLPLPLISIAPRGWKTN